MKAKVCTRCNKPYNSTLFECPHCSTPMEGQSDGPVGNSMSEGSNTVEGTTGTRE